MNSDSPLYYNAQFLSDLGFVSKTPPQPEQGGTGAPRINMDLY